MPGDLTTNWIVIEVSKVHDLAVEISAPVAVDHLRQEEARDHEEVGHAERPREFDQAVQPAGLAAGCLHAERRMHHHHEDDAEALGVVDPVDSPVIRLNAGHDFLMANSRFERLYTIATSRQCAGSRLSISALLWRRHRLRR
jgi:hypothetical protein